MRETPRPQGTADDARPALPQLRVGRALAHDSGAPVTPGAGNPHRSDGRPPQTPRGARHTDPLGRPGTTPPVPGRPALLALLCALLFAAITWQVLSHGPLRTLDERLDRAVVGRGPAPLTEFLADLGNLQVALPVLALALVFTAWRARRTTTPHWWLPPLTATAAMALLPALVAPLKAAVARPAPPALLEGTTGFYPSGHAATATLAYGATALLLSPHLPPLPRRLLTPTAALINLAVATGLVLRGYHWPLDTVGSWCLCGVLLCAVACVAGRCRPPRRDRPGT